VTKEAGSPGTVILVPGLAVAGYLRGTADALLEQGWRCHLLRPPGWPGADRASDPPPTAVPDLGAAVAGWIEQREGRVVLVGQSIGGQIAAHAAALSPQKVRLLVLQGPTVDPSYRTVARLLVRWLRNAPYERASLAVSQLPEWWTVGPRRVRRLLRACLDDSLRDTLSRVCCPVQVVVGDRDRMARRSWVVQLSERAPIVLPGGHTAAYSDPAAFARAVTAAAVGAP
jgi:pimeloyl-ACP methyl ester carboxylesterase